MKRKITGTFLISMLAAIVFVLAVSFAFMSRHQVQQAERQLGMALDTVVAVDTEISGELLGALHTRFGDTVRLTHIDPDGSVRYDSQLNHEDMINHMDRQEITDAERSGRGEDIRRSESTGVRTIYVCAKLTDGSFLRLATPVSVTREFAVSVLPPVAVFSALLMVLAVFVSNLLSASVLAPYMEFARSLRAVVSSGEKYRPDYVSADPELLEMIASIEQVSEQLAAYTQELSDRTNEINAIIGSVEDGIILLSRDGHVLIANRAAARIFPVSGVFTEVCRSGELAESVRGVIAGGGSDFVEISPASMPDRIFRCLISPATNGTEPVGAVISITDITAIKHLEGMRSEFVSNVSHELKSPLTSIRGFAELMHADMLPDDASRQRYLSIIIKESTRLISIIDDIIHLSEIEQDTQGCGGCEQVELRKMVQEILDLNEGHIAERKITAQIAGDGTLCTDRSALYDIMENLVSNAVKYNRDAGELEISISPVDGGFEIAVRDSGIGIAQEDIELIYQRFYRSDKARSKRENSTGLGLAIVKHSLGRIGASIRTESELGAGSCFTVFVPDMSKS